MCACSSKEVVMFKFVLLGLVLVAVLCLCSCSWFRVLFKIPDRNKIKYLYDSNNRIAIYRGINISNYQKRSPEYRNWMAEEDYAKLPKWGFNFVRYLVFWDGIEPVKGHYDYSYITRVIDDLRILEKYGVDVVIDFHQDLMAKRFTGCGFPDWSVKDNGLKFIEQKPWSKNYFEPPVLAAFTNFWNDEVMKGLYLEAVVAMMRQIESTDLKNVIGVDLINEPFPGTIIGFETNVLTRFYERAKKYFVKYTVRTPMYFEPAIQTSAGLPTGLRVKGNGRIVYFPHYYDRLVHDGDNYDELNYKILEKSMKIKVLEAQRFKSPLLIGEWGMRHHKGYLTFLRDFCDLCDKYAVGWAYWSYDKEEHNHYGIVDNDKKERPQMEELVRVYPQKIAGRNPRFEINGNKFTLTYIAHNCGAPTEIFIPEHLRGVKITAEGKDVAYNGARVFKHTNVALFEKVKIRIEWDD